MSLREPGARAIGCWIRPGRAASCRDSITTGAAGVGRISVRAKALGVRFGWAAAEGAAPGTPFRCQSSLAAVGRLTRRSTVHTSCCGPSSRRRSQATSRPDSLVPKSSTRRDPRLRCPNRWRADLAGAVGRSARSARQRGQRGPPWRRGEPLGPVNPSTWFGAPAAYAGSRAGRPHPERHSALARAPQHRWSRGTAGAESQRNP
jgi:hypothetical protein